MIGMMSLWFVSCLLSIGRMKCSAYCSACEGLCQQGSNSKNIQRPFRLSKCVDKKYLRYIWTIAPSLGLFIIVIHVSLSLLLFRACTVFHKLFLAELHSGDQPCCPFKINPTNLPCLTTLPNAIQLHSAF